MKTLAILSLGLALVLGSSACGGGDSGLSLGDSCGTCSEYMCERFEEGCPDDECLGTDAGDGEMYCAGPCEDDADCEGGGRELVCLTECLLTPSRGGTCLTPADFEVYSTYCDL